MPLIAVDFETEGIETRPEYPPKAVGVAITEGRKSEYLCWGHPCENNCTKRQAIARLKKIYKNKSNQVIFHNAPFDLDVGETHLGLPWPERFEDSQILAYLFDPRDKSLALKDLAAKYLDMPADEQAMLRDWVLANVPEAAKKPKNWGAYICRAPGKLAGKYAKGDTIRTLKLFKYYYLTVCRDMEMAPAYDREIRLVKVKLHMERKGVYARQKKLKKELPIFKQLRDKLEGRIKRRLGITKKKESTYKDGRFNMNSSQQLARALDEANKVTAFIETAKGNISVSMDNLKLTCPDKKLLLDLDMHSTLETYINTFLSNWIVQAEKGNGFIHPTFNLIRSTDDQGGGYGTKTGRPSSSNPNFNNIPADVMEAKKRDTLLALAKEFKKMGVDFVGLRDYLAPDPGKVFINRDYSQQEIRVLAHYEDGALMRAFLEDPNLDMHYHVQQEVIRLVGLKLPRKFIKTVNFLNIYGGGENALAYQLGIPRGEARQIKNAVMKVLPGVKELDKELKRFAHNDQPIRTWGGRVYYCEEAKYVGDRYMDFAYKMLNLLIQGSSADVTKEAMLRSFEAGIDVRLQVYDELMGIANPKTWRDEMVVLKESMESVQLDVPLPTDGSYSRISWGRMKETK